MLLSLEWSFYISHKYHHQSQLEIRYRWTRRGFCSLQIVFARSRTGTRTNILQQITVPRVQIMSWVDGMLPECLGWYCWACLLFSDWLNGGCVGGNKISFRFYASTLSFSSTLALLFGFTSAHPSIYAATPPLLHNSLQCNNERTVEQEA